MSWGLSEYAPCKHMFAPHWCCSCTPPSKGGLTGGPHREKDVLQAPELKAKAFMVGRWQGVL